MLKMQTNKRKRIYTKPIKLSDSLLKKIKKSKSSTTTNQGVGVIQNTPNLVLAKELNNHSLPEIGDAFGGRYHTTVMHACRKIKELMQEMNDIAEDHKNLLRILTN